MTRTVEPEFVGRTYDDFLFRPQASPLASRREVPLRTALTRRLVLELPIVSANMDTVTRAPMAIVQVITTSICTCCTSFVLRVMSEPGPNFETSRSEKPLTLPYTSRRMSRPIAMAARAAK